MIRTIQTEGESGEKAEIKGPRLPSRSPRREYPARACRARGTPRASTEILKLKKRGHQIGGRRSILPVEFRLSAERDSV